MKSILTLSFILTGLCSFAQTEPNISYSGPKTYIVGTQITDLSPTNSGGLVPATQNVGDASFPAIGWGGQAQQLAFNADKSILYGTGVNTYRVFQMNMSTNVQSLLAGSSVGYLDGTASVAKFASVFGLAIHPNSEDIYVSEYQYVNTVNNVYVYSNLIRKITPLGVVTTYAGKPGLNPATSVNGNISETTTTLSTSKSIAFSKSGELYIAESSKIRKIALDGTVSTLNLTRAGNSFSFSTCFGMHYYYDKVSQEEYLYVTDAATNIGKIYKINLSNNTVSLIAGDVAGFSDGTVNNARFNGPRGLALDAATGNLYVADYGNNRIRKITPDGVVSTIAGSSTNATILGIGTSAQFRFTAGLALDGKGNLYVGEAGASTVRKIQLSSYAISPDLPAGLIFDGKTGTISGTPTAYSAAKDYTITTFNENGRSSAILNIEIAKGTATITLGDLNQTYDGNPKSATATTIPANLPGLSITYDGSTTAPTAAGTYAVIASLNNDNYTETNATGTLTIAKGTATITLSNLSQAYDGNPKSATATTNPADLKEISFTYTGINPTTYAQSNNPPTEAGTYTVVASLDNANYEAPDATEKLTIAKGTATITLGDLNQTYDGNPKSATATTNPANLPGMSITYDGSTTAPTAAGTYAVIASLNNANYTETNATGILTITQGTAMITLSNLSQTYDGNPKSATATTNPANLGINFTYTGINPTTYAQSNNPPTEAGTYTVVASLDNANYEAPDATGTLVIATVLPIKFGAVTAKSKDAVVEVKWQSLTEVAVKEYQVERSTDGKIFSKAGTVAASGKTEYSFLDMNPLGATLYYRVIAVDNSGEQNSSKIVVVKRSIKDAFVIKIYPNPVDQKVANLLINNDKSAVYTLKVIDAAGKIIFTNKIQHNGSSVPYQVELPANTSPGIYTFTIQSAADQFKQKVIIK